MDIKHYTTVHHSYLCFKQYFPVLILCLVSVSHVSLIPVSQLPSFNTTLLIGWNFCAWLLLMSLICYLHLGMSILLIIHDEFQLTLVLSSCFLRITCLIVLPVFRLHLSSTQYQRRSVMLVTLSLPIGNPNRFSPLSIVSLY